MSVMDDTTRLAFTLHENRGVYALLLGSGVSRSASIPTGWEITLDLVRRVALAGGVEEQDDWARWHRETEAGEPDYSALLARLSSSPAERQSILQNYIEPTPDERETGLKTPTAAHRAIARMVAAGVVKVIVTTNFDRLLEMALREHGVEPTVIGSADALEGAPPLAHCACYVLKIHGDYKDARILNTDEELAVYPEVSNRLLDRILDEYGLIVCGWSGEWDPALRAAILRAPSRRYGAFWISRGEPKARAAELIQHRGARVIAAQDADSFFTGLQQRLETLAATGAQNPVGVDLQVATAKRYLARPEDRIRLDALIEEELARVHARLGHAELLAAGDPAEEFRRHVGVYETSLETLAAMIGVLGRWGDGTETRLVFDVLRDLHQWKATRQGGLSILLGLRAYPAVLVFIAYGLGLVRAERWSVLHNLFKLKLRPQYEEPVPLVESLLLDALDDLSDEIWRLLPDVSNKKGAMSTHLLSVFGEWRRRFLGLTPEFERDYHLFETLAGLAHAERHELPTLQQAATNIRNGGVFIPVGHVIWARDGLSRLREEIEGSLQTGLLKAGFGRGEEDHLRAALDTMSAIASYRRW